MLPVFVVFASGRRYLSNRRVPSELHSSERHPRLFCTTGHVFLAPEGATTLRFVRLSRLRIYRPLLCLSPRECHFTSFRSALPVADISSSRRIYFHNNKKRRERPVSTYCSSDNISFVKILLKTPGPKTMPSHSFAKSFASAKLINPT